MIRPPLTGRQADIGQMIAIEPRLGILLQSARNLKTRGRTDWHDYAHFKRRLSRLVGHGAEDDRLASCDCYEVAIVALTEGLGL